MKLDQLLSWTLDLDEEGSKKIEGMIKNWGSWLDIIGVRFPQTASFGIWLENYYHDKSLGVTSHSSCV